MKVLFDHQTFSLQRYGGISRYFNNLRDGLDEQNVDIDIAILYSENEYIHRQDAPLNNALGKKLFTGHNNRIYRWNRRFSTWKIKAGNFDILHPTYYNPYYIDCLTKPCIVTIHDMIYEQMPEQFIDGEQIVSGKRQIIEHAKAIIAISEYTRQEIIKIYPDVQNKITVVHHGYQAISAYKAVNMLLPVHYILFVGERKGYKNFERLVLALRPVLEADEALVLLCAGGGKFTDNELTLIENTGLARQFKQMNVTDQELKQLYSQANLFVFPSLQEGFGLPLLEAFASNCPVVCSNTSSLPEVAGPAAVYFNPFDTGSIQKAIEEVLYNEHNRQRLKVQGSERLKLFTLEACAANTIKVYQSVL